MAKQEGEIIGDAQCTGAPLLVACCVKAYVSRKGPFTARAATPQVCELITGVVVGHDF